MTTPAYKILADDVDVTSAFDGQLVQLTITDKQGTEADECELQVWDRRGKLALPRRGVIIRPSIGWLGQTLNDKGAYQVDEVEHSGPPDLIRIKGRAAQMQGKIKEQREASYTGQTLKQILSTIAGRHALTPAVNETLGGTLISHIDQTNESDLNFLTRLGKDYDAIATIKDGRLLFLPAGTGKTASGQDLATATLTRRSGVTHSFTISDREGGDTTVKAKWRDLDSAETKEATVAVGPPPSASNPTRQVYPTEIKDSPPPTTTPAPSGTVKTLRRVYPTEAEATAAATAAVTKAQRAQREIRITLDVGMPELIAGQPLRLERFRPEIDEVPWVIQDVTHTLTEGEGLHTTLTAQG